MKKYLILIIISLTILTGCADVDLSNQTDDAQASSSSTQTAEFKGEKGMFIPLESDGVNIEAASVSDGKVHFYNTTMSDGKSAYFFVVKSPDGKLRAAANGCQVCGAALQGFRQEGDEIVCNTCGNRYHLDKVATEKGGCNPAPISPDLKVENGMINISTSKLEDILTFF